MDVVAGLAWLYRETVRQVDEYEKRVKEGLDLAAANTFCRHVENSGIEKLSRLNAPELPARIDSGRSQFGGRICNGRFTDALRL